MKIDETNNNIKRIYHGVELHYGKKCNIMSKQDHVAWIQSGASKLKYDTPPEPLRNVIKEATVVAVHASEMGDIQIVREHQRDKPCIYNVDRYTVIMNLDLNTAFPLICKKARVRDTPDLRKAFRDYVFIVGPYKDERHQFEKLPECFRERGK